MISDSIAPVAAIDLRDLHYRYPDGSHALRGVTLAVPSGQCLGVVGPNGAGKSTLLWHLNGLLPDPLPHDPNVLIAGRPVTRSNVHDIRRRVGLVFQDPDDQLFCPTVAEDVAFGPRQLGLKETDVQQRVALALSEMEMAGYEQRHPHHLSGGEQRRVCIAGVLACRPDVLVLDEPSHGLDPFARRQLIRLLARMSITRLVATHDLELVVELCQRTVILDAGRIVADGATTAILGNETLMHQHRLERPHILSHRHPHG